MKKILFFTVFFSVLSVYAQQLECGVPDVSYNSEMQRQLLVQKLKNNKNYSKKAGQITYIPVKMHLIGKDDNTGYLDNNSVNNALAELNKDFQHIDIQFYFSGTNFHLYPSSQFYDYNNTDDELRNLNLSIGANNAINLYVSNVVKANSKVVGGYTYQTPSSQTYNYIIIKKAQLDDDKTTSHEFGHYFGLPHTFNNAASGTIADRELVTRKVNESLPRLSANCSTTGDYLCDTPADPFGNGDDSYDNCVYKGTVKDANNDLFTPNGHNFMDYKFCPPYSFTLGQSAKMSDGALIVTNPGKNYTLNAPETVQNPPSNVVATRSGTYSGGIFLSWKDNSTVETGYIIESSISATGPFKAIKGVEANATSSTVPENSESITYYRIKPSNSKNNYSTISNGIKETVLCGNNNLQTCDLETNANLPAWYIKQFILKRNEATLINNITNCSTMGIGNYYDTTPAIVSANDKLNFTISSKAGADGSVYPINTKIFVDWNNDNVFDDATETVFANTVKEWGNVSGSFIVPANISGKDFRMRVAMTASTSGNITPCSLSFGEFEDYKLTNSKLSVEQQGNYINNVVGFPNPFKEEFNLKIISLIDDMVYVRVYDMIGRLVEQKNGPAKDVSQIKIGSICPSGVYNVIVTQGMEVKTLRMIKQ